MLSDAKEASERFAAEEHVDVAWDRIWHIQPILFHEELVALAEESIDEVAGQSHRLPSGPLHDAAEVARIGIPTVMVFVQSLRGLSHTKLEDTRPEHLELVGAGARPARLEGDPLGRVAAVKYEHEVEIERSPEDVYAFLSDPENLPKWQHEVLEVRRESEHGVHRGADVHRAAHGVEDRGDRCRPRPGVLASVRRGTGALRRAAPPGAGGRREDAAPRAGRVGGRRRLFKLGGRLLRRAIERRAREDFERLKELLESERS